MFCSLLIFFSKSTFSKKKHFRVSNRLDPEQARRFVGPGLVPNCLQKVSTDETSERRVKFKFIRL